MTSGHIHVRTKFSNKSINHTVETGLIYMNTETHHICLTYILLKTQHSHNQKKKCKLINFFICRLIYIYIYISFYLYLYTNNFFFNVYYFFFLHLLPPWGGCPSPWACGAYPRAMHVGVKRVIGRGCKCVGLRVSLMG